MKLKILNTFFFLILIANFGFSQNYEGLVGGYKISIELDIYDNNNISGYYFYDNRLKNIQLEGELVGTSIELYKKYTKKSNKLELFQLEIIEDSIIGNWTNNGKSQTVKLKISNTEFDKVKKSKIEFIRDSIQKIGNKEVVWLSEKYSNISHFRLGNGFTVKQRQFFNPKLDSMHNTFAIDYLNCEDLYLNIQLELVTDTFVCFSEDISVYCGGAHPNYGLNSYNFDIIKMTNIENIKDIYPNLDFYNLIKSKYQNDTNLEKDCDYFTLDFKDSYWAYSNWVLTSHGLTITPDFPHAMTPCEIPFYLTYNDIENY
jgi:hypothetical protein